MSSLGLVSMLIIQFVLGIIYNLYGKGPTATESVGMFSSPVLALHVILFFLLVIAGLGQLIRAVGARHRLTLWMSALGLLAILAAWLRRDRVHRQRRRRGVPRHVAGLRGGADGLRRADLRPGSPGALVNYLM